MAEYTEIHKTADAILNLYATQGRTGGWVASDIIGQLGLTNSNSGAVMPAIAKLLKDGHFDEGGHHGLHYKLGGDALIFRGAGGYEAQIARENRESEIRSVFSELENETNQNVIATGKSVQKLNKLLQPATIVQGITAIVTLAIAGLAAYISWLSYLNTQVNDGLKTRQEQLEQKLIEQQKQLDKIPLQAVKDTVYMIEKLKK